MRLAFRHELEEPEGGALSLRALTRARFGGLDPAALDAVFWPGAAARAAGRPPPAAPQSAEACLVGCAPVRNRFALEGLLERVVQFGEAADCDRREHGCTCVQLHWGAELACSGNAADHAQPWLFAAGAEVAVAMVWDGRASVRRLVAAERECVAFELPVGDGDGVVAYLTEQGLDVTYSRQ